MKTIKILGIIFALFVLCAFTSGAYAGDVKFSELNNFFVKNNVKLENSENYFVVNNQKEFLNLFGMARTMTNTIEQVDFSKYLVVAVVLNATNKETDIKINSVKEKNDNLCIKYSIKRGKEQSYSSVPFKAIKVAKGSYTNVSFSKGFLKKTIPLNN